VRSKRSHYFPLLLTQELVQVIRLRRVILVYPRRTNCLRRISALLARHRIIRLSEYKSGQNFEFSQALIYAIFPLILKTHFAIYYALYLGPSPSNEKCTDLHKLHRMNSMSSTKTTVPPLKYPRKTTE